MSEEIGKIIQFSRKADNEEGAGLVTDNETHSAEIIKVAPSCEKKIIKVGDKVEINTGKNFFDSCIGKVKIGNNIFDVDNIDRDNKHLLLNALATNTWLIKDINLDPENKIHLCGLEFLPPETSAIKISPIWIFVDSKILKKLPNVSNKTNEPKNWID